MTVSPMLGRLVKLGERTGVVMDLAPQDFTTSSVPEADNIVRHIISPAAGGWRLLVLVGDKLEVWNASEVTVE
jgi:hypothetical protein